MKSQNQKLASDDCSQTSSLKLLDVWDGVDSLGDASEGLDHSARGAPVARLAVFPLSQEVLASAEVGVLVENPAAVEHFTGVDLSPAELLLERGAVFCRVNDLTPEVDLLIELDLEWRSTGLQDDGRGGLATEGCEYIVTFH